MEKAARGEFFTQAADQDIGLFALGRANGIRVPFLRLEIVDGNEGRLAAHGEADVL
ncbi:hypothetical protein D3C86_2206560 [compost metagenome]